MITLHFVAFCCILLPSITFHYITLHYIHTYICKYITFIPAHIYYVCTMYYIPYTIYCILFTIYYLLYTIYYLLYTIYHILSTKYRIILSLNFSNHSCQLKKKQTEKKLSFAGLTSFFCEWASSRSLCTDQSSIPSSIRPSSAQIHRRFGRHMISLPPCSIVRTSSKETTEPPKLGRP